MRFLSIRLKADSTRYLLLLSLAIAGCGPAAPEQQFIDDAMRSVGGRERLAAVKTFEFVGEGVNFNLGQDMRPDLGSQTFQITDYKRRIDLATGRQRVAQVRTPKFAYFQGPLPQLQTMALDGAVAFNINAEGQPVRVGTLAETDRRHDFYHHPLTLLHATLDEKTQVGNVRSVGATRQADITTAAGPVLTMTIDAAGLPLSISSKAYHPNLGDVVMTTTFTEYRDVSGLRLPAILSAKIDDFTLGQLRADDQTVDADVGDLSAPAEVAAKPVTPAAPNVTVEPVSKGIWFLAGGGHHSVLVEFADHLMLIEAPQSEARTLAVIAKAKETVPKKPLTQLVTSHHHFDHTAGMRAAIAEGMNVITQAGNRAWVEAMAKRPHTIQPDALQKNPTRLVIETVDDEKTYQDAAMQVVLYHLSGNPHSDTMLMAYFPRERVLVEVDAYSPGAGPHIYAANLVQHIDNRKLRVDRVVPLHGTIGTMAELRKALPQPAQ